MSGLAWFVIGGLVGAALTWAGVLDVLFGALSELAAGLGV